MILGFCGAIQSGKSTSCRLLRELNPEYKEYSFADELKLECSQYMPKEELGYVSESIWSGPKTEKGRAFLCSYAEEARAKDPNHWLNKVKDKIHKDNPVIALCSDLRYTNECNWIHSIGKVVYIRRKAKEQEYLINNLLKHKTEQSELEFRFWLLSKNQGKPEVCYPLNFNEDNYWLIENNETIEELNKKLIKLDTALALLRCFNK